MNQELQQLEQAVQDARIAMDTFLDKRRKIMNPLRLRYSLHLLILLVPFGAIMAWQIANLEDAPLHIFCMFILSTFFVGIFTSFAIVHRTSCGKQLDALDRGDYENYPELQNAVRELRIKNLHMRELSAKIQKSS